MDTQVRVSASGPGMSAIKKAVGSLLVTMGFWKTANGEYTRHDPIDPDEARKIIDGAYDIEKGYSGSRIVTLHILSELNIVILRRSRNRAA